ncbi:MAG: bacteriohemerythrin [Rhodospirillales bacterium]
MPIVEWSDKYNTGIPDIDKEHRSLFALINDLYDKVEAGSAEISIKATFEALADYVNYHFAREESLMAACHYNDLENHKAEHRKLKSRVENYKQSYERDPQSFDMADFMEFLTHWLQGHILRSDMAYIPYVQYRVDTIVGNHAD